MRWKCIWVLHISIQYKNEITVNSGKVKTLTGHILYKHAHLYPLLWSTFTSEQLLFIYCVDVKMMGYLTLI